MLNLHFWNDNHIFQTPCGSEKLLTHLRPFPRSHWRTCEVSTLYLGNSANAGKIYVFEWLTLYSRVPGKTYNRFVNPSLTCPVESSFDVPVREVIDVHVNFQIFILKTVQMHVEFTFNELLTLYSWPLWWYDRIVHPSLTCPMESLTDLWSFSSVSWKMCECMSN